MTHEHLARSLIGSLAFRFKRRKTKQENHFMPFHSIPIHYFLTMETIVKKKPNSIKSRTQKMPNSRTKKSHQSFGIYVFVFLPICMQKIQKKNKNNVGRSERITDSLR